LTLIIVSASSSTSASLGIIVTAD
jgi:hypothetical protein